MSIFEDGALSKSDIENALFGDADLYDWQIPPMESTWRTYGDQITSDVNDAIFGTNMGSVSLSLPRWDAYEAQKVLIMEEAINENLDLFEELLEESSLFDWDDDDDDDDDDGGFFGDLVEAISDWW
jgi:hypothetical protein